MPCRCRAMAGISSHPLGWCCSARYQQRSRPPDTTAKPRRSPSLCTCPVSAWFTALTETQPEAGSTSWQSCHEPGRTGHTRTNYTFVNLLKSCSSGPAVAAGQQMVGLGCRRRMGPTAPQMGFQRRHRHHLHRRHAINEIAAAAPSARLSTAITTPPHLLLPPATFVPQRRPAPASYWADSTTRPARASPDRSPPSSSSSEDGRSPIGSSAPAPHGCVGPPSWCCMWSFRS